MTVKEFARRAEISLSLAYSLIDEGRVPGVRRIGRRKGQGKILVSEEGLTEFLKQCEIEQQAN